MLCDLHWINYKKIIIIHDDLPFLDHHEFKNYLEILIEASEFCKKERIIDFEIIFPESLASFVLNCLKGHFE